MLPVCPKIPAMSFPLKEVKLCRRVQRSGPRQRSASSRSSRVGDFRDECRAIVSSTTRQIIPKVIRPAIKASTATSLAAFKTAAQRPAILGHLKGQSQRPKTFHVRRLKIQGKRLGNIQSPADPIPPLRIRQRILNRRPHIGRRKLRNH